MSWALIGIGVVLDLMGIVWVLQGFNVLGGSPMSGEMFWAGAGAVTALLGSGLIAWGARLASRRSRDK